MDKEKNTDRKVFETWMSTTRCYPALSLDENGEYGNMMTLWTWKGWLAENSHDATPNLDPVETMHRATANTQNCINACQKCIADCELLLAEKLNRTPVQPYRGRRG